MHELGIVFHIAKKVEQVAKDNNVEHINRVVVQIGEVSTVIPDYLYDCWNWNAKKSPILEGCKLEVERIPAITFCEDCEQESARVCSTGRRNREIRQDLSTL